MTRGIRHQSSEIQVQLLREGIVESIHHVTAVVCDHRSRVLSLAGSGETTAFIRSALKPFQALAVTASGTIERYGLSEKDLAIMCSSHRGTVEQSRQVFNILWRCDIDPTFLRCPIPKGKESPLQHNCSGKHAGMLAVCKQRNFPLENYLHRSHPVQKIIIDKVGEILGMPGDEFIRARDDCGAPTYSMQMGQMAALYGHFSSGDNLDLERIVRAMTYHPRLIAGDGAFDTEVMRLTEGELVSKSGAEGVQCVGRIGEGMGLAVKVRDGSKRAKYAATVHILLQLGWISPSVSESLAEFFLKIDDYKRLEVIGEVEMV